MMMRKFVKKYAPFWSSLSIFPGSMVIYVLGECFEWNKVLVICLQIPLLAVQIFSIFILIRYGKTILKSM